MKFLEKKTQKKAFTLAELIVAVIISSIVLTVLMSFITQSMNEISYGNKQTKVLESINDFSTTVNSYKGKYKLGTLLIDLSSGSGSDILMLTKDDNTKGIIIGVVSKETLTIENNTDDYNKIYKKYLGIRELVESDITTLNSTPTEAYNLLFNSDKINSNLVIKNFQVAMFNSGSIVDTNIDILINYKDGMDGELWDSILGEWVYSIGLNF